MDKENRCSFENFKSNVCHMLKRLGDEKFVYTVLQSNEIIKYWEIGWYPEALYMLAMVDYISRINNIPLCTKFNQLRKAKLKEILYPKGVYLQYLFNNHNEQILKDSYNNAIPEFKRFNIVENEVRDIA